VAALAAASAAAAAATAAAPKNKKRYRWEWALEGGRVNPGAYLIVLKDDAGGEGR